MWTWTLPLLAGVAFLVWGVRAWESNPLLSVALWVMGAVWVSLSYRQRVRRP